MKSLLIHGYGTKINLTPSKKYSGFSAFQNEIDNNQACVFNWGIPTKFSKLDHINPFKHFQLYKSEKKLSKSSVVLTSLDKTISNTKPSTIICHSMGCYLFTQYLQNFQIPKSVTNIIFLSSDCNIKDIAQIKNPHPKIHNYFCPWDNALISSIIVNHQHLPIGLYPSKNNHIQNHFWPLWIPINLHDSNKKDIFFKKKITPGGVTRNLSK